jgi:hypothetical protein
MTQTQTQTAEKQNTFAALDKKVADGIAADKAATQPQPAVQAPDQPAVTPLTLVTDPAKQLAAAAPAVKS